MLAAFVLKRRTVATLSGAVLCGLCAAFLAGRLAPPPTASVARGSEELFGTGLFERELPPRGKLLRWTRAESVYRFCHLPARPLTLTVQAHGHRGMCLVAADGVVVDAMAPAATRGNYEVRARQGALTVVLACETFRAADGRDLGTQLGDVSVSWTGWALPGLPLVLLFIVPVLVTAASLLLSRCRPGCACASAALTAALECLLLLPSGGIWSAYAAQVATLVAIAAVLGALFARLAARSAPGAEAWAGVAFLATWWVQVILATSPLMVASDAVFQSHVLTAVASGDLFPVSRTQHVPPFQIPYGVSFFALLAPLARSGFDPVRLVRWGSALAGAAATLALFPLLVRRSARLAGLTVILLNLLPGVFLIYSQGNLANVFGQAATIGFLAWWAGSARGGAAVGALLFALSALGHLSSFVVLVIWAAALLLLRTHDSAPLRPRRLALLLGASVAGLYYAHFLPLIVAQLPRVLHGSGKPGSLLTPWLLQAEGIGLGVWGAPVVVLAWIGRPRWRASSSDRTFATLWIAGGVLLLLATLSPVEVRYLYALTPLVAVAAASGTQELLARPRGWIPAAALLGAQLVLAGHGLIDRLLWHYR